MSNHFDPTKLDLSIDNTPGTPNTPDTQVQKSTGNTTHDVLEEKKQENTQQTPQDILTELPSAQKSPIQTEKNVTKEAEHTPTEAKNTNTTPEAVQAEGVQKEEVKKIIDINISNLEDLILLLEDKKYDYVTLEPEDTQVKIIFRQDNVQRDVRYVKFPVYTNILFKLKQSTGLIIEDTGSPQEGKGHINIGSQRFHILSKTAPGQNGEKIWIKSKQVTQKEKIKKKKTSLSTIFGFLGAILFIVLILFGIFIGFIVFNAKTVEDVEFFRSLGINLNDINTFIGTLVSIVFSILTFIATVVLSFSLFKFLTTKKIYKQKKVVFGVLSTFLLFVTL